MDTRNQLTNINTLIKVHILHISTPRCLCVLVSCPLGALILLLSIILSHLLVMYTRIFFHVSY